MAGKQYKVRVAFDERDDKTGREKRYEPGQTYSGSNAESHLKGHDDQGPLIYDEPSSTSNSDSSKEN